MSTAETIKEAVSDNGEEERRVAADYQAVFGTSQGERVLAHLLNQVLLTDLGLSRRHPNAELSSNDAMYLLSRHDAARQIRHILNIEFKDDPKPVVRHGISRFTSRPGRM